jgi:hypothetical protein
MYLSDNHLVDLLLDCTKQTHHPISYTLRYIPVTFIHGLESENGLQMVSCTLALEAQTLFMPLFTQACGGL